MPSAGRVGGLALSPCRRARAGMQLFWNMATAMSGNQTRTHHATSSGPQGRLPQRSDRKSTNTQSVTAPQLDAQKPQPGTTRAPLGRETVHTPRSVHTREQRPVDTGVHGARARGAGGWVGFRSSVWSDRAHLSSHVPICHTMDVLEVTKVCWRRRWRAVGEAG